MTAGLPASVQTSWTRAPRTGGRERVREYVERTSRRELLDEVLDEELPPFAEALARLGR